jgi:glutamate synthase domain-containing protein 2
MGIATQDAALRANLKVEKSARRLENFLGVTTNELIAFARLTGNNTVRGLSIADMCTVNTGRSRYTSIEHV